jgi:hypothetical protein
MNRVLRRAASTALAVAVCLASAHAAQDAKAKQKEFDDLLARVKASDESVDFARLRMAATELESYSAYGSSGGKEMHAALNGGDFKKALDLAGGVLKDNYLDVDAHIVSMIAADKLGDAARSAHHRYVVKGIVDSIAKSGDGKTAETAFKVIAVSEEYALVRVMGLRPQAQALRHADGHSYDVLTVVDPESNTESEIFFNIDPIWRAETKLFEK